MAKHTKRKDLPQQRQSQILTAATELFSQHGYHGVTVDAIAQQVGISKGNIYWYFKSKQEIFLQLFDYLAEQLFMPAQDVLKADLPPREKLRTLTRGLLEAYEANPEIISLVMQIAGLRELREMVSYDYTLWMRQYIDLLAPLFAEIGEEKPEEIALFYAVTLDGLIGCFLMGAEIYDKETIMGILEERFIDFISTG